MSSLKMTFSLASLIFLIALGLIFVPTSVLAHPDASSAVDTPREHSHPLADDLDAQTNADGTTPGTQVTRHYGHPTVSSVVLKEVEDVTSGNMAVITADDTGTTDVNEHGLTLIVTFSEKVNTASGASLTVTAADVLATGTDLTIQVRDAKGAIVASAHDDSGTVTRSGDGGMAFEVPITFEAVAIPNGTADHAQEYLTLYVKVNAEVAAFGLAMPAGIDPDIPGGTNVESSVYDFRLVKTFPTTPDATPPTVVVKAPEMPVDGKLPFMITFNESLETKGFGAFTEHDITITGGTAMFDPTGAAKKDTDFTGPVAGDDDEQVYTLKVMPDDGGSVTVTVGTQIQDTSGLPLDTDGSTLSATYDRTAPTVMITPPETPETDGNLTFTFVFSESIEPNSFDTNDIRGNGFSLVASIPMKQPSTDTTTMTETWTVKVTPVTPNTAVTVALNAGAVRDMNNNPLATGMTATYTPPTPSAPGAPTSVMATALTGDDAGKITISWTAPTEMGTPPLTGYFVTKHYTDANGAAATKRFPATGTIPKTATSYTIPPAGSADMMVPPGTYTFTVSAVNTAGSTASAMSASVTIKGATDNPPVFAPNAKTAHTFTAGTEVSRILPKATDTEDDAAGVSLIYSIDDDTPLPSGLDFDEDSRVVSGMPDNAGSVDVKYMVMDSADQTAELVITFTVEAAPADPPDPPTTQPGSPTFDKVIDNITATVGTAIEGVTLPAATDPDGDDGRITYSLSPALPRGLMFNERTRRLSGTPRASTNGAREYTYTATDVSRRTASLAFDINVKSKVVVTPTPTGDLNATYANWVTTINAGSIGPNGFATIGSEDLPDLEAFFDVGGTIGLSNGDATDDKNSRDVVISEILWGLDLGAPVDDQTMWQFIELYNTTGTAIPLTGWTLTFTAGRPSPFPAIDIDQVSNRRDAGWNLDEGATHGQSGRVTGTLATDLTSAITPTNIISMYRNIDYVKVEKTYAEDNRKKQLDGFPSGTASGSWKSSQRRSAYNRWIYDSKRGKHFKSTPILAASSVARTPFIINEIGNGSDDTNDWVEIRNVTGSEASLKNYHLSVVTAVGTDTSLVNFHEKDIKVPGNSVILLVNTDPRNTGIAAGRNAAVAEADQELTGATSRYYINSNLKLPDTGKFNLILRNAHDKLKASSHFMDVVGGQIYVDDSKATSQWPLVATGAPHGDVIEDNGRDLISPRVYIRKNAGGGTGEHHLGRVGYTGVGYDRVALKSDANGGTPGYDNGALKDKIKDGATVVLTDGAITFSEIMLDTGPGNRSLSQWIELYNSSMTQAVNLNGWKLTVENDATDKDITTRVDATITLKSMTIAPNQTVLIVTTSGRNSDPDHFPSTRVVNLWTDKDHRTALGTQSRTEQVFSTVGLYLKLTDTKGNLVDEFGNLDGDRRTRTETPMWTFPMNKENGDDRRSSLIRRYTNGTEDGAGTTKKAWVLASETNFADLIGNTYYGDPDDFGTPGFRGGGPLPVNLSKFRPERLDDGSIRIAWITESELNNAGFNILRSDTRNGQFTQINTSLIKGQGTTSERTTYAFPDTSAKPNVVYYYQIQDVSLDGNVTTLRQSRLKGDISAAGKLTTTWGELKALQ